MTTRVPRMIGMLGGTRWESSAPYYRLTNELVGERLGGLHSARVVLAPVDFADVEALQVTGRWSEAGQLLAEAAKGARGRRCQAAADLHQYDAQDRRAGPSRRRDRRCTEGDR